MSCPSVPVSPRVIAWRANYYAYRQACRSVARGDLDTASAMLAGPQGDYVRRRMLSRPHRDDALARFIATIEPRACGAARPTEQDSPARRSRLVAEKLEDRLRFAKLDGYCPTPYAVASRMVELARIVAGDRVLEPSAGGGRLVDAILAVEPFANVDACEVAIPAREVLVVKREYQTFDLIGSDFIKTRGQADYDAILMHPPLAAGADAIHVAHAWKHLRAGGRLVAIVADGTLHRPDRDARRVREFVDRYGHSPDGELIAGGMGDPPATPARLIVLDKPQ